MGLAAFKPTSNGLYHENELIIKYHAKDMQSTDEFASSWYGTIARTFGFEGQPLTLDSWRTGCYGYLPTGDRTKPETLIPLRADPIQLDENGRPTKEEMKKMEDNNSDRRVLLGTAAHAGDKTTDIARVLLNDEQLKIFQRGKKKALEKVMDAIEKYALYRLDANGDTKKLGLGLLFATFEHLENRALEPFHHDHIEIIWTCLCQESTPDAPEFRTLLNDVICHNRDEFSLIFDREMMKVWRDDLGFELEPTYTKRDDQDDYLDDDRKNIYSFKIKGIPEEIVEMFSTREKELQEAMEESGDFTDKGKDLAQVSTRGQKDQSISKEELLAKWRAQMEEKGFTQEEFQKLATFKKHEYKSITDVELPHDFEIYQGFEREKGDVKFKEVNFKAFTARQYMFDLTDDDADRLAEKFFYKEQLAIWDKDDQQFADDFQAALKNPDTPPAELEKWMITGGMNVSHTFKYMRKREEDALAYVEQHKDDTRFMYSDSEVYAFIHDFEQRKSEELSTPKKQVKFKLKNDQMRSAIETLSRPGRITVFQGSPGTGKSTEAELLIEFLESKGHACFGTAPSSKATKLLAPAFTRKNRVFNTAKFIRDYNKGKIDIPQNSVIFIDESAMGDGVVWNQFLDKIARQTNSKVIALGDSNQLQAVGVAGLHRFIAENKQEYVTVLDEITRQRDDWQKEMVMNAGAGQSFLSMRQLWDHNRIVITDTEEEKLEAVAKCYLDDKNEVKEKLIMAGLNKECDLINAKVQELQKQTQTEEVESHTFKCKDKVQREFSVGDRILLTKKIKAMTEEGMDVSVDNRERGYVTGFKYDKRHKKYRLRVQFEDVNGKKTNELYVDPTKAAITLDYASTVHANQGNTVNESYLCPSPNMINLHFMYVMLSRHRDNTTLFLSKEMMNNILKNSSAMIPSTEKQQAIVSSIAEKNGIEVKTEELQSFKFCRKFLDDHWYNMGGFESTVPAELEHFQALFEAMAKTDFKKTTLEYQVIDQQAFDTYRDFKTQNEAKRTEATKNLRFDAKQAALDKYKSKQEKLEEELKAATIKKPSTKSKKHTQKQTKLILSPKNKRKKEELENS